MSFLKEQKTEKLISQGEQNSQKIILHSVQNSEKIVELCSKILEKISHSEENNLWFYGRCYRCKKETLLLWLFNGDKNYVFLCSECFENLIASTFKSSGMEEEQFCEWFSNAFRVVNPRTYLLRASEIYEKVLNFWKNSGF